jgi:hypothetical protein
MRVPIDLKIPRRNVIEQPHRRIPASRSSCLNVNLVPVRLVAVHRHGARKSHRRTPGIAASCPAMLVLHPRHHRGSATSKSGIHMRIVCTCCRVRKPRLHIAQRANVRIISTALTSSTSAMATCATTSTFRERLPLPACARRPFPLPIVSAVPALPSAYFSTGIDPKNNPEKNRKQQRETSELPSSVISLSRGKSAGPIAVSSRNPPYATPTASTPPSKSQQHALHQQLARNAPAPRSQCGRGSKAPAAAHPPSPAADSQCSCRQSASPAQPSPSPPTARCPRCQSPDL